MEVVVLILEISHLILGSEIPLSLILVAWTNPTSVIIALLFVNVMLTTLMLFALGIPPTPPGMG